MSRELARRDTCVVLRGQFWKREEGKAGVTRQLAASLYIPQSLFHLLFCDFPRRGFAVFAKCRLQCVKCMAMSTQN